MRARIRNEGTGPARVDIYDDIGSDFWGGGVSAQDFAAQMAGVRGPLDVHINSYGGDVFAGQTMAEAIRNHPGPVTTKIDGIAASIASVIAQAGSKRVIAPGGLLMLHDAWSMAEGNAADMRAEAETLDKVSNVLAGEYARAAGGTVEQWRGVMQKTAWYDAQEALDAGLVDEIGGGAAQCPPSVDVESLAASAPGRIMAALRSMPQAAAGDPCKTCGGSGRLKHPGSGKNGMKCPGCAGTGTYSPGDDDDDDGQGGDNGDGDNEGMQDRAQGAAQGKAGDEQLGSGWVRGSNGKVRFDPDGDGDDDSTPEGDTDHDYFDADGKEIKPIPPCPVSRDSLDDRLWAVYRQAVRDAGGKVDNSPWDGGKAMAAGADADDPAAFYKGICAGKKDGNPAVQSSWALPYKYAPGDPPNAGGVKAALGRLSQTEGLTNEADAKKTLQAAMKVVNPDWEPEDSGDRDISGAVALEAVRAALKGAQ